jgi:hypothetical protein
MAEESTIYGIPIIQSDLIPPGEIWTVARPERPGDPPRVVRLSNLFTTDVLDEDGDG